MQKNYFVGKYELDENQMKVINNDENSLIIAGAGSGKTLTILGKVNYLIENRICLPQEILIISFTNASVNDIKEKINNNIDVYTFHKLSMSILQKVKLKYSLCSKNILKYIIEESIKTCIINDQKSILQFLKLNINYQSFLKSKYFSSFCSLIETFINIYKTNNMSATDISQKKFSSVEKKILIIIFKIYQNYLSEKSSTHKLDFDDLIIYASNMAEVAFLKYKYIIIDEFQDTSLIRLNLVKQIYKFTNSKIIVVGDDWQSIYRFSGCNLNIFLNFSNNFPNVQNITLTNTYRNSLELISIASQFIQKNPFQIKKQLKSSKRNSAPIILVPYINKILTLKKLLDKLLKSTNDIMILSRNNKDIFEYIDNDYVFQNNILYYKNHPILYYTVHSSKGLEAGHVIILNCNNSLLGFPNKIENNIIVDKLFPNTEFKFAEERRLFYVAITRCKEKSYLIYDINNPSIFIKEIKKIIRKNTKKINYFK